MEEKKVKATADATTNIVATPAEKKSKKSASEKLADGCEQAMACADTVAEASAEMMKDLGFENVEAVADGDKVSINIDLADLQKMQAEKVEMERMKKELAEQKKALEKAKMEQEVATAIAEMKEEKPALALKAEKPVEKKVVSAAKPVAKKEKKAPAERKFHNRLHEKYVTEVAPKLMEKYGNIMAVPKIDKIILNMGLGDVKDDTKKFTAAVEELGIITGQKAVVTKAKKSISNFKLREGQRIGAKVTLRGKYMYLFLDKLISVALPRVRDFSGLSTKSFDRFGNYAMGIKEQLVFPEIIYDKVEKVRGFDIAIVTTAKDKATSLELLKEIGLPFKKDNK